ncbi:hypothetical protein Hdeb2414_s1229g00994351 [Helianthus debilis subsp. tardiflorus]
MLYLTEKKKKRLYGNKRSFSLDSRSQQIYKSKIYGYSWGSSQFSFTDSIKSNSFKSGLCLIR